MSGLRGVVGSDIGVRNFLSAGSAFGRFVDGKTCLVGRDTRKSADMAANAVVAGLLSQGCKVFDLGVVSTPAVFREVKTRNAEGGISITSSHNPPDWNGVKFIAAPGRGVFEEELLTIENHMQDGWGLRNGKYFKVETNYTNNVVAFFGRGSCSGVKVALDLGGGAGCAFLPRALEDLGARVFSLNATPGIFSRVIDPTADSLGGLSNAINTHGCDVGFGYDCDVDRLVIMDKEGRKIPADFTLLFGLKYFYEKERLDKACISIDTSLSVVNYLRSIKAKVYRAKVGEGNVLRKMLEENCNAGGEGSSGGFIYSPMNMCRDGLLISGIVLSLIARRGSLEEIQDGVEKFVQERRKLSCRRDLAPSVMAILARKFPDAESIDGIAIFPTEDSWILIRPSNTENVMRLSAEAKTEETAMKLGQEYSKIVVSAIAEAG